MIEHVRVLYIRANPPTFLKGALIQEIWQFYSSRSKAISKNFRLWGLQLNFLVRKVFNFLLHFLKRQVFISLFVGSKIENDCHFEYCVNIATTGWGGWEVRTTEIKIPQVLPIGINKLQKRAGNTLSHMRLMHFWTRTGSFYFEFTQYNFKRGFDLKSLQDCSYQREALNVLTALTT